MDISHELFPLWPSCSFYSLLDRLQDVEDQLNTVAAESGAQIDRLVKIVQENGEIQKEIKEMLEAEVTQSIMTAVITTDRDGNFTLDHNEVYELEYRLMGIPGVVFHREMFRKFIASDQDDLTLTDVSNMIKNLEDETISDTERIFTFEPKAILEEAKEKAAVEAAALAS